MAMRDPEFMAQLLQDPFGFLKGLAAGDLPAASGLPKIWGAGEPPVHFTRVHPTLKLSH
jgi:hypothetical protein